MPEVITEREVSILEFDQIRQQLSGLTISPMAAAEAESLLPLSDQGMVEEKLKETSEARLLCSKNAFNPGPVIEIKDYISRAEKGALLSGFELSSIMAFLKNVGQWARFFQEEEPCQLYPLLSKKALKIKPCAGLVSALNKALDQDGNILDEASTELASLRKKKLSLQNKIRDKLDEYTRSNNYRRYLQEALVTIRGNRYVLPVRQEYRHFIEGVVHDQSSSGATLFIEPLPVVQLQNDLAALQRREEKEMERILYQLSSEVASSSHLLLEDRSLYSELDLIVARGRLSLKMNGIEPELVESEKLIYCLDGATHPLLPGAKVPLKADLGDPVQTLVITGPNTGGKTVALKTIGLLAAMIQSGLHVPTGKGTRLTVFKKIRADIGDEQSIAQSLSTFSGHMKNIIEILSDADRESLVLFDELGAGTDPSEGAALAMAILEELKNKGALTIATTHINELKLFAQVQDKMQNAAMEFDPHTLTPTYLLLQGVPGQSNAFYIAERLRLPQNVLIKAKSFVHRSHEQVESIIASLVEDQQRFHRDRRQAAQDRSRAEMLAEQLQREQELLRARRDDILREAREEARLMIRSAKSITDQLIRELRELRSSKSEKPLAEAEKIRGQLNLLRREVESNEDDFIEDYNTAPGEINVGQQVMIRSLKQKGEVLSVTGEEALVQVGSMKVHLAVAELVPQQQKKSSKETTKVSGGYSVSKDLSISNSIDLRGLNFDEAQTLVDKLLDNALWAGLGQIELIHGKGTGRLKQGLRSYLKEHPLVNSYRSGENTEGGEGVTVVKVKL